MFCAMIKTQHNIVIKWFYCYFGGEYASNKFSHFLAYDGTITKHFFNYTPQQNGIAERKQCHIIETACTILLPDLILSEF